METEATIAPVTDDQILKYLADIGDEMTNNPREGIFVLRNGSIVSGQYEMGNRGVDHNDLLGLFPGLDVTDGHVEPWGQVHAATGVVRLVAESGKALTMEGQELTAAQQKVVRDGGYEVAAATPAVTMAPAANQSHPQQSEQRDPAAVVPEVPHAAKDNLDEVMIKSDQASAWWFKQLREHAGQALKITLVDANGEERLYATLTKSSRPNVDLQLTSFAKDGGPQSHLEFSQDVLNEWENNALLSELPHSSPDTHYLASWEEQAVEKAKPKAANKGITEKMILHAKTVSILDVAAKNGVNLVHDGGDYWSWDQHDSLKVNARKNQFIWNSRQVGGSTIDFMMKVVGVDNFQQAVTALNDNSLSTTKVTAEDRKPFEYDIQNSQDFTKVRDYLTLARGLNPSIVDQLHQRGFIQQDSKGNAVFVWAHDGERVGASIQGTTIDKKRNGPRGTFKQIAKNSEQDYGFNFSIGRPRQLYVFESPIDALSYLSLHPQTKDTMFFAMDGLKPQTVTKAMVYFHSRTGNVPERVGFGVDNDPAGHRFFDEMINKHAFVNVKTGETLPYGHFMVDNLAIPQARLKVLQQQAAAAGVPWEPLAALDKVETNFHDDKEVNNWFGLKGGFTHGDGMAAGDAYGERAGQLASLMHDLTGQNGLDYQALIKRLDPALDPTMQQAVITKIKSYTGQYENLGAKPVRYQIKDWNDRLKQVQNESGFPSRVIDRIYVKKDDENALKVIQERNQDGEDHLKAVQANQLNKGLFEADSPQEMAYLVKTYGYSAVDKEDERKYQQAPDVKAAAPRKQASALAQQATQAAAQAVAQ